MYMMCYEERMKGCKNHRFAFCNIQYIDCAFLKRTRLCFFNLSEPVDTTVPYLLLDFRYLELTETLGLCCSTSQAVQFYCGSLSQPVSVAGHVFSDMGRDVNMCTHICSYLHGNK